MVPSPWLMAPGSRPLIPSPCSLAWHSPEAGLRSAADTLPLCGTLERAELVDVLAVRVLEALALEREELHGVTQVQLQHRLQLSGECKTPQLEAGG
jgi:hypothetical protein